jgi:cytochrome P450
MAPKFPFSEPQGLTLDPEYARLRRDEPVSWVEFPYGGEGWLVTGYREARFVHGDSRFIRAPIGGGDVPRTMQNVIPAGSMITMDGVDHARMRRMVAAAFTPRRAEDLRPRVQEIADDLLDRLDNPGDLVEGYTLPVPVMVMCELLGVPFEDRADFRLWTEWAMLTSDGAHTPQEAADGAAKLFGYIADLVAQCRAAPSDGLFGTLVAARDEGGALSEHELVVVAMTLLVAGQETMVNQLGSITATILERPLLMARLREDPGLLPGAVEELLRFVPMFSTAGLARIAAEDVRIGDVTVREGQAVLVVVASANRDESVFERPDELDPGRDAGQHFAFGHGSHYCLGAQLARMEMQVAVGTLLRRRPGLRLAEPVEFKKGLNLRGPRRLIVAW